MCRFCPNLPKPTQERTNPPLSSAGIRSFSQLTVLQPAESPGMVVSLRYFSYFAKNTHGLLRDFFWIFPDFSRFFLGLKNRFFTNLFTMKKSIFYEKKGRILGNLE